MKAILSTSLAIGLALASAMPGTAATRDSDGDVTSVISRPMVLRDSDGDVTSVICPIWLDDIRVLYRFDGVGPGVELPVAEIAAVLDRPDSAIAGGSAAVVRAGGQEYLVQARGDGVLLRDLTSGTVYRGTAVREVRRDGRVLATNPKAFGLD